MSDRLILRSMLKLSFWLNSPSFRVSRTSPESNAVHVTSSGWSPRISTNFLVATTCLEEASSRQRDISEMQGPAMRHSHLLFTPPSSEKQISPVEMPTCTVSVSVSTLATSRAHISAAWGVSDCERLEEVSGEGFLAMVSTASSWNTQMMASPANLMMSPRKWYTISISCPMKPLVAFCSSSMPDLPLAQYWPDRRVNPEMSTIMHTPSKKKLAGFISYCGSHL
mmetsp:Transcript_25401/g.56255  ORF Transcript_25401/g.56255 Transcript_25401/m.56255 type:complete len:224 (-) Transcript_25401:487-1158(-)